MTAPKTHWQVFETPEPLLAWDAAFPVDGDAGPDVVRAIVADVCAAVVDSGLVVACSADDVTGVEAVLDGRAKKLATTVRVRDGDAVVTRTCTDPGALWRTLEGEGTDPAYAERFAALGHPCVALWSTVSAGRVDVAVAFFATMFFDERDHEVWSQNQAQLRATRVALEAVTRRRGGRLTAPLTLQAPAG
jgi:hypothetical protein